MNHLITIRKIPDSIADLTRGTDEYNEAVTALELTDNEIFRLLQRWPQAANVGGNFAFNSILPDAIEPFLVSSLVDEEGKMLEGKLLIAGIGKVMTASDRSKSIHCTMSQFIFFTESDEWRIYAKLIDDKSLLEEAFERVFGVGLDLRKSLVKLQDESSEAIRTALK
jgi:hypothetical protein